MFCVLVVRSLCARCALVRWRRRTTTPPTSRRILIVQSPINTTQNQQQQQQHKKTVAKGRATHSNCVMYAFVCCIIHMVREICNMLGHLRFFVSLVEQLLEWYTRKVRFFASHCDWLWKLKPLGPNCKRRKSHWFCPSRIFMAWILCCVLGGTDFMTVLIDRTTR